MSGFSSYFEGKILYAKEKWQIIFDSKPILGNLVKSESDSNKNNEYDFKKTLVPLCISDLNFRLPPFPNSQFLMESSFTCDRPQKCTTIFLRLLPSSLPIGTGCLTKDVYFSNINLKNLNNQAILIRIE